MILLLGYAFLAGLATVLSPCALPLLPILLAGTSGNSLRPWGIVAGFVGGFLVFSLGLAWLIQTVALPPDALRWTAGTLLFAFGLVTAVPALQVRFQSWLAPLVARSPRAVPGRSQGGFGSGLAIGLGLGLAWSPCVGPIMASVLTLALTQALTGGAFAVALAFSLGTGTAFLAAMLGGKALLKSVPGLVRWSETAQKVLGGALIVAGVAILAGWDRAFATWVLATFPGYGTGLTAWEQSADVLSRLEALEP